VNTRRQFLIRAPLGLAGALAACKTAGVSPQGGIAPAAGPDGATAGAPPAFNTAPPVGPEVTPATFAEAEKLMQVQLTPAQREMAAASWRTSMAPLLERRTGPRKVVLPDTLAPATVFEPVVAGETAGPARDRFVRSDTAVGALPASDEDIAFATVAQLSRWIQSRALTSERLTRIYLDRIRRFDPELHCVITLVPEVASVGRGAAPR
jgi:hypothetical protein